MSARFLARLPGRSRSGIGARWSPHSEANLWKVVVSEGKGHEWSEFDGGVSAFLSALFVKRSSVASFRRDWPESGAVSSFLGPVELPGPFVGPGADSVVGEGVGA
jgi:hypothetical protein